MYPWIQTMPPIKRLQLKSIDCWDNLNLEFTNGLNIITEIGSAPGKSNILKSMVPALFLKNSLSSTKGTHEGRIHIE